MLGGLIQPCILIPERLDDDDVDPDSVRLILLHELAHADRGDVWFSALAGLSQAFWFYLPHLWWLRSQLRIDQEFLADRRAAEPIGDSAAYARWLVGLASARESSYQGQGPPRADTDAPAVPWWKGGFKSPLLQRVAMLLYCPFHVEEHAPQWFAIIMPAFLMTTAIAVSSCRLLAPLDPSSLLQEARPRDPLVSSFHIPEFHLVPGGGTAVLPLALPPSFKLTANLRASSRALAQIRLAGYPMSPSTADVADEPPAWHAVLILRNRSGLSVHLDGQVVALDKPTAEAEPNHPEWLTIAPAQDSTAIFRDILVTW